MPPIKRSPELVTLSHEHYDGLKFCRNLKLGEKLQVEVSRMAGYIQWFWDNHLLHHFQQEENLLFRAVENEGIPRALEEHAAIRQLVTVAIENPSYEHNNKIATLVNDHIRYEERELFRHSKNKWTRQPSKALAKPCRMHTHKDAPSNTTINFGFSPLT